MEKQARFLFPAMESFTEACRPHNISKPTYFRWKKKYGGMNVNGAARLKTLEEENSRLKRLVADLSLDNQILEEVNSKNGELRAEESGH